MTPPKTRSRQKASEEEREPARLESLRGEYGPPTEQRGDALGMLPPRPRTASIVSTTTSSLARSRRARAQLEIDEKLAEAARCVMVAERDLQEAELAVECAQEEERATAERAVKRAKIVCEFAKKEEMLVRKLAKTREILEDAEYDAALEGELLYATPPTPNTEAESLRDEGRGEERTPSPPAATPAAGGGDATSKHVHAPSSSKFQERSQVAGDDTTEATEARNIVANENTHSPPPRRACTPRVASDEEGKKVDRHKVDPLSTRPLTAAMNNAGRDNGEIIQVARANLYDAPVDEAPPHKGPENNAVSHLAASIDRILHKESVALPTFTGEQEEWLNFKSAYDRSTVRHGYKADDNVARLQTALKGEARKLVASRLFCGGDPVAIMKTLERRYGHPSSIVIAEVTKLRELAYLREDGDIQSFAAAVENGVGTLKSLQRSGHLHNPELVAAVREKLPPTLRSKYRDFAFDRSYEKTGIPELETMAEFLCREADKALEVDGPSAFMKRSSKAQPPPSPPSGRRRGNSSRAHVATNEAAPRPSECALCKSPGHAQALAECPSFRRMNEAARWGEVKRLRQCYRCLKGVHRYRWCRAVSCSVCGGPHHRMLHEERRTRDAPESVRSAEASQVPQRDHNVDGSDRVPDTAHVTTAVARGGETKRGLGRRAFLRIVPVVLRGPAGEVPTYALLDTGSQVTLLRAELAERLGAKGPRRRLCVNGINGQAVQGRSSMCVQLKVRGKSGATWHDIADVRTTTGLNLGVHTVTEASLEGCPHLQTLADVLLYEHVEPALLIGEDNWALMEPLETKRGLEHQPVASLTPLGWVLHGYRVQESPGAGNAFHLRYDDIRDLHETVRRNFDIEAMGIMPRLPQSPKEMKAIEILEKTTRRCEDGRFEVGLLWANGDDTFLPDSEKLALSRLSSLERKFKTNPTLKAMYKAKMQETLAAGYAEECPAGKPAVDAKVWYLPHFAVENPHKPGKIRIVLDAAARIDNVSLNDNLLAGPDLLQPILGVLMRFREGAVAVTGDIKDMFLRVRMREEDRDAQRFLWREDPSLPPRHYRMTTLIFGAKASPFSALYVKDTNARMSGANDKVVETIVRDHYMDDAIFSARTIQEAAETARDVADTHARAGFMMRGWRSNAPSALEYVRDIAQGDERSFDADVSKTLGLVWRPEADVLAFNTNFVRVPQCVVSGATVPTKRQSLSFVMSIFDPLGLLSPLTTEGKVLLQRVWESKVQWDEPISHEINNQWRAWIVHLNCLETLTIPRFHGLNGSSADIHVFCDASTSAYAAVAYWRHRSDGLIKTSLIASKSRVAPLRPLTVPRLELQAAVLGVRLAQSIVEHHRTTATELTYWSDSRTVLAWIKAEEARQYKPFVAHRVAEIIETTRRDQWRWVPTKENPADLATRPPPRDFGGAHWWFAGPPLLGQDEEEWPVEDPASLNEMTSEEEKRANVANEAPKSNQNTVLPDLSRFSNWNRLMRATARVLQAADIFKKIRAEPNTPAGIVGPQHVSKAELLWLGQVQADCFGDKVMNSAASLREQKAVGIHKLSPYLDNKGVLRAAGRIDAANGFPMETKRPAIIHGDHPYVRLMISHYHVKYGHGNHETVVNELRQKFWVIRLRGTVRAVAHSCPLCRMRADKPMIPPQGDLPRGRLLHNQRPFTSTGVDYFGPMEVTVGRRREKRWGALFTCLTTRAIHIELASTLSADSMLMALRRMVARRGTPAEIWSDNATNFVRANRELKEAREEMDKFGLAAAGMCISWRFTAPGAPNQGGAWERLIRSVKTALAVTLRERAPKEEVLLTLIAEAEHIVNSRPLTYVSLQNQEEALTPNHFLIGTSSGAPVPAHAVERDLVGPATWRTAQRLADHFWRRWVREYLPTLVPRGASSQSEDLQCGDVVLLVDHTLPRNTWPRCLVKRVYRGPDGRVRVVDVDTSTGTLRRRPVRNLIKLVINEGESLVV